MFPELSKIFGRDFVIGFFLPALLFCLVQVATGLLLFTDVSRFASDSDASVGRQAPASDPPIRPIAGRILVRTHKPARKPAATSPGRLLSGEVVAADNEHVLANGERALQNVAVGDTVYFPENAGHSPVNGDPTLRILSETDLVARTPGTAANLAPPPTLPQLVSAQAVMALALASWFVGILLLAVNRWVYRFAEGYMRFNPFRLVGGLEKWNFQRLKKQIDALDARYDELSPDDRRHRDRLWLRMVDTFPDEPWLLPTRFGNIIRSFEAYPLTMYGLDAIPGWERLELVFAPEIKDAVNARRTQVDFWLNLWFIGLFLTAQFTWLTVQGDVAWWTPVVMLVATLVALQFAKAEAGIWGESVKAAVDISLTKLAQELGLAVPPDREHERRFWETFSRAILFRREDLLPRRVSPEDAAQRTPPSPPNPAPPLVLSTGLFTIAESLPAPAPPPSTVAPVKATPAHGADDAGEPKP